MKAKRDNYIMYRRHPGHDAPDMTRMPIFSPASRDFKEACEYALSSNNYYYLYDNILAGMNYVLHGLDGENKANSPLYHTCLRRCDGYKMHFYK